MAKKLDVYLHHDLVGQLVIDEHGQMLFGYAESWLGNPSGMPLSNSLPLQDGRFKRNACRGFFAGILPEESKRELVARNLGISKTNDFAMLEQIGGECAGAVTFVPAGEPYPERDYRYRELTDRELAHIQELLPRQPLLAGEEGVRISLAGAQDKIAVHVADNKISLPLGGAPSTHILKPAIKRFEGLVFNEAFCLQLAAVVGLPVAKAEIHKFENIDYLLVERYDRHIDAEGDVHRLHQEDFCQALGFPPEKKYQSEGGPTLKQCFELVRGVSSCPVIDLARLLDAVIFNSLIGNHDAHGKNFSFIQDRGDTQLAPLYDLVSTVYYPELTKKMAMKIGKEAESDKLSLTHFERLAEDAGLGQPMVRKRVPELAEQVRASLEKVKIDHAVVCKLTALIHNRCNLFLS